MKRLLAIIVVLFSLIALPRVATTGDWEHVESLEIEDQVIRAVWAAFVDRLNSGDIEGAVGYHTPDNRESLTEIYELLGEELKKLPDNWSELAEPEMYGPFVSYKLMDQSTRQIYSVTFLKMPDGQWLIDSL